ncbi:MAG: hypothetical protein A7315_11890 [Candidatus Altiarchaeales archaeon WOR_SM1_79]|nr:MAG: hypothetical protein A7315_11890 [Candidatus Altiarchaeales archaeon WOR_SM1_79]
MWFTRWQVAVLDQHVKEMGAENHADCWRITSRTVYMGERGKRLYFLTQMDIRWKIYSLRKETIRTNEMGFVANPYRG